MYIINFYNKIWDATIKYMYGSFTGRYSNTWWMCGTKKQERSKRYRRKKKKKTKKIRKK